MGVLDGVAKGGRAGEAGVGRKGDGLSAGTEGGRSSGPIADADKRDRVPVRVRAVGKNRGGGNGKRGIGGSGEAADIVGYRRRLGGAGGAESHIDPVIARIEGEARERATAVNVHAVAAAGRTRRSRQWAVGMGSGKVRFIGGI